MEFAEYVVSAYALTGDLYADKPLPSKADFFSAMLATDKRFVGADTEYAYECLEKQEHVVAGIFGTPKPLEAGGGPNDGWQPKLTEKWDDYFLFFDTRQVPDGQRLWVQTRGNSTNKRFVKALENEINRDKSKGWEIQISPLVNSDNLNQVLEKYRSTINKISFHFTRANLPTGINSSIAELRSAIGKANARLKTDVISDHGSIDTNAEAVVEVIKVAEKSGARIEVFTPEPGNKRSRRHKKRFDSVKVKNIRRKAIQLIESESVADVKDRALELIKALF